jgi:hypothetical protein
MFQLLVTANIPSSLILFTLMMEVIHSSKTLVHTRATWHHIPEDSIPHSDCREDLKSSKEVCGFAEFHMLPHHLYQILENLSATVTSTEYW